MHNNIRPGLGLQCMIVVFPGHTHLFFFLVFDMYSEKIIKIQKVSERRVCLFKYMLVNSHLFCNSSNSMI